jgi:hypothetical protein
LLDRDNSENRDWTLPVEAAEDFNGGISDSTNRMPTVFSVGYLRKVSPSA